MKLNKKPLALLFRQKAVRVLWAVFRLGIIVGVAYVILYPILVKMSVAFMSEADMYDLTVKWVPRQITLDNFIEVSELVDYGSYLLNTFLLSAAATLVQVASCTLAAYGFARFPFKGRGILFFLVILTLVIPPQTYLVTSYMQYRFFDGFGLMALFGVHPTSLINTPWPVLIMSFGCQAIKNGLFIYILRQFLARLPHELEEAAWVDGAGVFRIFRSIMLPNAGPAITTVSVLSFVWCWNDLYTANTYMPGLKLFPTLLSNIAFQVQQAAGGASVIDTVKLSMLTNAGALMIIAPLLLLFILAQKFFVAGVERTGLTGM